MLALPRSFGKSGSVGVSCRGHLQYIVGARQKMLNAYHRLRAKGATCSCLTAFNVERGILARAAQSRLSIAWVPRLFMPHDNSFLCEESSFWLGISAVWVACVAGQFSGGPSVSLLLWGG